MGLYADLQRELTDQGAFIFMLQPVWETAMRSNVHGVVQGVTEDLVFYRLISK